MENLDETCSVSSSFVEVNLLDGVHDLVAILADYVSHRWVTVLDVIKSGLEYEVQEEQCVQALDNWVDLQIMSYNADGTLVMFLVTPNAPEDAGNTEETTCLICAIFGAHKEQICWHCCEQLEAAPRRWC